MKALVYHGPGQISLDEKPQPTILKTTDAIVRITKTTLCGTDLAILKGGVPTAAPGRILGHEGVGVVEAVGSSVVNFKPGDHVLISCITACGKCEYCKREMYSNCLDGGWMLGNTIDGVQAEYARVPYADNGLYHIPTCINEEAALMLADIVPTGLEVGVLNGEVKFGDTLAIIGAGPVGLAALLVAQFYSPAQIIVIDLDENRLEVAKRLGATFTVDNRQGQAIAAVMELTGGRGVDVAIEAVGNPATCELVQAIIGVGGRIANVGVYAKSAELHKELLWTRNITLRMGVVNTRTIPLLLKTVQTGKLDPTRLITHHFRFDDIQQAYAVFANAAQERAIKIILSTDQAATTAGLATDQALIEQLVAKVLAKVT